MANNFDMNIDKKYLIDFATLKVGDKLWHLLTSDWLEVDKIDDGYYPISTPIANYTQDGKDDTDDILPVLFKSNPFPYPKKMLVWNGKEDEPLEQVVVAEFDGTFMAFNGIGFNGFDFAKDLPESPKVELEEVEVTFDEIAAWKKCSVEQLKVKMVRK